MSEPTIAPATPTQKLTGTLLGLLFAGAGAGIMIMVWLDPAQARVPLWVVYAAAGCFVAAGLWIIAQTFGQKGLATLFGLAIAWLLAVPGLWILFGGDASCTVSLGGGSLAMQAAGPDWVCRGIFGLGGLLAGTIALAFTWQAITRRASGTNRTG